MTLTDRDWTNFVIEAEVDHYGTRRIVETHNALRAALAEQEVLISKSGAMIVQQQAQLAAARAAMNETENYLVYGVVQTNTRLLQKVRAALAAMDNN